MRNRFLAARAAAVSALVLALSPAGAALAGGGTTAAPERAASRAPAVGPITDISKSCPGQNAEVEQAADPATGYLYEEWMGCRHGIAFARSTDGGLHFSKPIVLPGSAGGWDPAVAVAPDGTVYAAFMNRTRKHTFPVVDRSYDHGHSFPGIRRLVPRKKHNWGDREFLTVAPDGTIYLTWDYGPSAKKVTFICTKGGSCAFATGDLNLVLQKSADGGRHWSRIIHVSPGFPASGGDSGPVLAEPGGRIDVLYQGYHIINRKTYAMKPAHTYFTSSVDRGKTWSHPVRVGPKRLTMSLAEWWIDGSLSMDQAGDLYATFDTQSPKHQRPRRDVGWLSYSTNHGRTWSRLIRATPDRDNAPHITQVAAGRAGIAYVGWLASNSRRGYAQYLRPFSIARGWLSGPVRISRKFGNKAVWPGDTFGISALPRPPGRARKPQRIALSWGSAVGGQGAATSPAFATHPPRLLRPLPGGGLRRPPSEIFATVVTYR